METTCPRMIWSRRSKSMGDLICPKCGDSWESFGITYAKGEGDLTLEEVKRFFSEFSTMQEVK
jgi:hypothetical protein